MHIPPGLAGLFIAALFGSAMASRLSHRLGTALSLYYTITPIAAGGLAGLFLLAFCFRVPHAEERLQASSPISSFRRGPL